MSSKPQHSTPLVYAAWTIRAALLVLYIPVQAAMLFVRAMLGLDAWASAIVQGRPEVVLAAPPLSAVGAPSEEFATDFAGEALRLPLQHEIPAAEIRYHI